MIHEDILTVVTPADSYALISLETVKEELGITDSSTDALLTRWINEESEAIAGYTERVWGQETVSELIRRDYAYFHNTGYGLGLAGENRETKLKLQRWPVASVTSIVEDDTDTLTEGTDFEVDFKAGIVYRIFDGLPYRWRRRKTVVTYVGGYVLPDNVPLRAQQACLALIKGRWGSRTRDPALRSFNIPGVIEKTFWTPGPNQNQMPPDIAELLDGLSERSF